jgi:hypothetical protein
MEDKIFISPWYQVLGFVKGSLDEFWVLYSLIIMIPFNLAWIYKLFYPIDPDLIHTPHKIKKDWAEWICKVCIWYPTWVYYPVDLLWATLA